MTSRLELQAMLENILESHYVYFQPPASVRMNYPAIVYELGGIDNSHANNLVYMQDKSYTITLIDKDPDNKIVDKISHLPKCRFDRFFTSDNLNHYVFTLYL